VEVERPKRSAPEPGRVRKPRSNVPLIVFALTCGVLVAAGGIGYTIVVWIVAAMLLVGLGRLIWWAVRGLFSE
jgi:hypothetical protein